MCGGFERFESLHYVRPYLNPFKCILYNEERIDEIKIGRPLFHILVPILVIAVPKGRVAF